MSALCGEHTSTPDLSRPRREEDRGLRKEWQIARGVVLGDVLAREKNRGKFRNHLGTHTLGTENNAVRDFST